MILENNDFKNIDIEQWNTDALILSSPLKLISLTHVCPDREYDFYSSL